MTFLGSEQPIITMCTIGTQYDYILDERDQRELSNNILQLRNGANIRELWLKQYRGEIKYKLSFNWCNYVTKTMIGALTININILDNKTYP